MLSIKNLQISYNKNLIIENLSLNVKKGEVLGILGRNGAGKTTLFNALYQNIPYKGEMSYEEVTDRSGKCYRSGQRDGQRALSAQPDAGVCPL